MNYFVVNYRFAFEQRAGKIISVGQRERFALRQRNARRYHRQGIVVIGDAAHTIHPLAGQGANLGFMDAAVLAEEFAKAKQRGYKLSSAYTLGRYQRRRMGNNVFMSAAMMGFQNLFNSDAPPVRWARNSGLKLINQSTIVKEMFIKQASGLSGDIPHFLK